MADNCSKCKCSVCLNQSGCEKSCEQCKRIGGYVSFCKDSKKTEQLTMDIFLSNKCD